jgi:UDP-N-acetyl-D-glucosamine dehydrogenase
VVENIIEAMSQQGKALSGSRVLILGMAYKRDIDDLRESPSLTIIELLRKRGANVEYNDPFFATVGQGRRYALNMTCTPLEQIPEFDCVVIVTDHTQYDFASIVKQAKLVVDTRNATKGIEAANILRC